MNGHHIDDGREKICRHCGWPEQAPVHLVCKFEPVVDYTQPEAEKPKDVACEDCRYRRCDPACPVGICGQLNPNSPGFLFPLASSPNRELVRALEELSHAAHVYFTEYKPVSGKLDIAAQLDAAVDKADELVSAYRGSQES